LVDGTENVTFFGKCTVCIALLLFAIPVVPGVLAYLACGVIIGAAEKQLGSFTLTMLLAWLVASLSVRLMNMCDECVDVYKYRDAKYACVHVFTYVIYMS